VGPGHEDARALGGEREERLRERRIQVQGEDVVDDDAVRPLEDGP